MREASWPGRSQARLCHNGAEKKVHPTRIINLNCWTRQYVARLSLGDDDQRFRMTVTSETTRRPFVVVCAVKNGETKDAWRESLNTRRARERIRTSDRISFFSSSFSPRRVEFPRANRDKEGRFIPRGINQRDNSHFATALFDYALFTAFAL